MTLSNECAICGAIYANAERHQAWHDELAAWAEIWEQELGRRLRGARPTGTDHPRSQR